MRIRRLAPAGLTRFADLLRSACDGTLGEDALASLRSLPADTTLSEEVSRAEVEPGALDGSRLQAAGYLSDRLAGLPEPETDMGLWAWLACVYFDVLCPKDRRGRRRPGAPAAYLPVLDSRRTYRHRLLGPYLVFRAHADDPYRALCLLSQPLSRPGNLVERLASRPRLVACPAAVGVATLLYCDSRNAIKPGAAASVDRLSDVLMQLDRTYDIYGMTADALLPLLPREFDAFRRGPRRSPARGRGRAPSGG